jgi:hypothetical protein
MKLVIHCGLHKTGTTSFQNFCRDNRSTLLDVGIHYPPYKDNYQHSFLIHDIQESGMSSIQEYLDHAYAEARGLCHTVLLSGEDFENCIVDVSLAADIESAAYKTGFESVTWVVVTRDQDELLHSLYAEMSKHGVTLRLDKLKQWAAKRGCLYISANLCNNIFVLDYYRFEDRFMQHTSGAHIVLRFEDFVRDTIGMALFEEILPEEKLAALRKTAVPKSGKKNIRLGKYQVEANYIATALGVERFSKRQYSFMLAPLIWLSRRKA